MGLPDPEDVLAKTRGAEEDEKDTELLPAQQSIEVDCKDGRGKHYADRFLFRVPTVGQQIEIGKMKAVYLPQGSPADVNAATIVDIVCYLTICIVFNDTFKKPAWWNLMNAYSMEPFTQLYGRCLEYEARFHGGGKKSRDDEGDLPEGNDGVEVPGNGEVRVGNEVRPASKRRETLAGDGS